MKAAVATAAHYYPRRPVDRLTIPTIHGANAIFWSAPGVGVGVYPYNNRATMT